MNELLDRAARVEAHRRRVQRDLRLRSNPLSKPGRKSHRAACQRLAGVVERLNRMARNAGWSL